MSPLFFFHSASTHQKCVDQDSWKYSLIRDIWATASNPCITSRLQEFNLERRLSYTSSPCEWYSHETPFLRPWFVPHHCHASKLVWTLFWVWFDEWYLNLISICLIYMYIYIYISMCFPKQCQSSVLHNFLIVHASYGLSLIRSPQIFSFATRVLFVESLKTSSRLPLHILFRKHPRKYITLGLIYLSHLMVYDSVWYANLSNCLHYPTTVSMNYLCHRRLSHLSLFFFNTIPVIFVLHEEE